MTSILEPPEWQAQDAPEFDIPSGEFVVYGTVYTVPEHSDKVHAIYQQLTHNAQSEPGTTYYCLSRDPSDSSVFHFFERYADKAAFEAHNEQQIVKDLISSGWMKNVRAVFGKGIEGVDGAVGKAGKE